MTILRHLVVVVVALFLLAGFTPGVTAGEEGSATKHEGSMMKEGKMKGGEGSATKAWACDEDHMKSMLQKKEDRECVVECVLADEDTRGILMEKIAEDPQLRKEMMHEFDVMMKKAHGGIDMEKHEEQMHGEGSMMKDEKMHHGEGSMMKDEGSESKRE